MPNAPKFAAALLVMTVLPLPAAADELADLKAELEALKQRVAQMEEGNDRQTDQIAQVRSNVPSWVPNFTWKGDLRVRNENIDQQNADGRNRNRIRARAGFVAKVNDTVRTEFALSSADDAAPANARSQNQTLGSSNSRKPIYLDLAYVEWQPLLEWKLTAGKMKTPWVRPGQSSYFDGDVNPEGLAVNFNRGAFFASSFYNVLAERGALPETTMVGAQLGFRPVVGPATLTLAASYFDLSHIKGFGDTANLLPAGNTTKTTGCVTGSPCIANDFNVIEGFAELAMPFAGHPLAVYVELAKNDAATTGLDTAWSAGVLYGKAADPHTWEVGYMYQSVEKDAQYGGYSDSDWGGGNTDYQGSAVKFGYAIARNWVFNAMLQVSDISRHTAPLDYKRLQIDLNFKY
jgi:hypothetical protein